jgi:RimJ/RimL family protein N-acetyltransferase
MSPDYLIITPRLELRLIPNEDAAQFQTLISDSPTLHQWIDWCEEDFNQEQAERFLLATRLNWVKSQAYGFGLYRRSDKQLLGMVAINELYHTFNMASLGYWVADKYQRQGYGKEALEGLISFSFEQLKMTRLEIVCDPLNLQSQQLAEQCGALFETLARNRFIFNGKPKEGLVYSLIPE